MSVLKSASLQEMRALAVGDAMLVALNGRQAPSLRTSLASAARAHRDAGHDFDWIISEITGWVVLERVAHDTAMADRIDRVAHWRGFHHPREVRAAAMAQAA